ncbi:MAG: hypothetical protein HYY50_03555 [Candidatus Kerfeldbacteria bacterium]|nr:hypothetical protein [Candidatus Kerfeldbacteria bacterium]
MTRERWQDFVGLVKDKFTVVAEGRESFDDRPGTREFIEFQGPLGHVRCELQVHPRIVGKRAIGGHRVGSGSKVQYEYSPDEETATLKVFKRVGDRWEPIDASLFS